ncbi:MAG: hypothetical protein JWO68_1914 [Actinomycetia bacterium]|nr:hypothetical protein [Actinomycetes bacterium]
MDPDAFLSARGAADVAHPGGTLLAHLRRTAALLESWDVRPALVTAGLGHAVYGTDSFPVVLATLDEREAVRAVLGDEAEAIVYRYAASDRPVTWDAIDRPAVPYRDRFTGETTTLEGAELADYWTLSTANELDLVERVPDGPSVLPLLRRGAYLLPPSVHW